ncbi:hypothetical protein LSTR_LSTR004736 [Laodelphax striatellus]|uniref:Uncharacterized protein n=1 Tax=Laodelphax striatellus TaxID=195883 RepID=A0A482XJJ7_LAOST|nr:hypothetical protein LSTR_LSTR004736 [Laodelphax striatellus]
MNALLQIRRKVEAEFKVDMTEAQLLKKIQNMKARIKKKAVINRTGNRKISLKSWEEQFLSRTRGGSEWALALPVFSCPPSGPPIKIQKLKLFEKVTGIMINIISKIN